MTCKILSGPVQAPADGCFGSGHRYSGGRREGLVGLLPNPAQTDARQSTPLVRVSEPIYSEGTFRVGLTPAPTCLPGQGGPPNAMWLFQEQPSR
jgi:hypothetical protein